MKKIIISGASGLLGQALTEHFRGQGHIVKSLVRRDIENEDEIFWDPVEGVLELEFLEGQDAIIHLSGESIASLRWSSRKKEKIRQSRIISTRFLANTLRSLVEPPEVFICASGVGYYGDRGCEELDEESEVGGDFLAELCRDWEREAKRVETSSIRRISMRLGVVFSANGGVLSLMKLPFLFGVGGRIANGKQYLSWIDLYDLVAAVEFCIKNSAIHGPVNFCSPNPVRNSELTKELSRVLHRPSLLPLPAAMVKLIMGEMGRLLLLNSTRALPKKLLASGYKFRSPTVFDTLSNQL